MQILTQEEFKKRYGQMGLDQFKIADQKKDKEEGLFSSIKNDLTARGQENQNILNEPSDGMLGNVEKGFKVAGNTAGGIGDVFGETVSRIPVVGSALKKGAEIVKGGYDKLTQGLGKTELFQNAAKNIPEGSTLDKGLNIAKSSGDIAMNILGADVGALGASRGASAVKTGTSRAIDAVPKPDLGAAAKYTKGAIRDVIPTRQNYIDQNLAKALELTPGDLATIEARSGNQVGRWLSDNNLIGNNKLSTQANVDQFFATNYKTVRDEIAKVPNEYKLNQVPGYYDSLKQVKQTIDGVPGQEEVIAQVDNLMNKNAITLADVQTAKELIDDFYKLYDTTGDVMQNAAKEGMANIRAKLQGFIEQEVKKNTGADIHVMNNNVSTARSLSDAIKKRSTRGLTRMHFTWRDAALGMGLTYFGSPLVGAAAVLVSKLLTSPTVRLRIARFLDGLDDAAKRKVSEDIRDGKVPKEIQKLVPENDSLVSQGN